jgi:putative ubiquitin-RnfH superfamily antitoxin RatB of RatAB toxin-antitoxin module
MIRVTLVSVPEPRISEIHRLTLPLGATVRDALVAVGWLAREDTLVGVFGEAVALDRPLKDGDQVESHRPLLLDPKAQRRARAAR